MRPPMFKSLLSTKVGMWVAVLVAASLVATVKVQCQRFENVRVERDELQLEVSAVKFELSEKQARVNTLELIRKGAQAVADEANKVPRKIAPLPGKEYIPAEVVVDKKTGVRLIKVEKEFLAQLLEDARSAKTKQKQIDRLEKGLKKTQKRLRVSVNANLRTGGLGILVGVVGTYLIMK